VDVPEVNGQQPLTKLYGNSAIYAMTIVDEETARAAAAQFQVKPIDVWSARRMLEGAKEEETYNGREAEPVDDEFEEEEAPQDEFPQFMADVLIDVAQTETDAQELFDAYLLWNDIIDAIPRKKQEFYQKMEVFGYPKLVTSANRIAFVGCKINEKFKEPGGEQEHDVFEFSEDVGL
jgi:hypothetical protein